MNSVTNFARLSLVVISLTLSPLTASAVEAEISGSITGGIYFFEADLGPAYAYGRGELPHLGKTFLNATIDYGWWNPLHTMEMQNLRLTAASGDFVYCECGPTLVNEVASVVSWEVTFTGGTGRFAGSTGTATLVLSLSAEDWLDGGRDYSILDGGFQLLDTTLNY